MKLTKEDVNAQIAALREPTSFDTPGALIDEVFQGRRDCHCCPNWQSPWIDYWVSLEGWLWLGDYDWKTVE